MNTLHLIAYGDLQIGVIFFIMSWPLILRKVPMNHGFGIRIPAAFESERRWYEINAYGGRQLAAWSLLLIATGIAGFFVSPENFKIYACGSLLAAILAITMPLLLILRRGKRP
jgi:uncharacterized membrane protein